MVDSAPMALNLKNPEVERLASEVATRTGESKTEAIRRALQERRDRLDLETHHPEKASTFIRYLEEEIWPKVSKEALRPLTKSEREAILGYGSDGA